MDRRCLTRKALGAALVTPLPPLPWGLFQGHSCKRTFLLYCSGVNWSGAVSGPCGSNLCEAASLADPGVRPWCCFLWVQAGPPWWWDRNA